jgi:uncharacterized membrane protein required for colicin V production
MTENTIAGLTVLQIALVSLLLLIVATNVWTGWQNGVVRQVFRLVSILAAYLIAYKAGPSVADLVPDIAILGSAKTVVVSVLTGFLTYLILRFICNMLFRKTREQESMVMRFLYGSGGAAVGLLFSVFFIVLTLTGIQLIGTVADAQTRVAEKRHERIPESMRSNAMAQFSKARQAITNGPLAPAVEMIDPLPASSYTTLDRISTVTADPEAIKRFVNFPGTQALMEQTSLKILAGDAEIKNLVQKKDFVGLLQNPSLAIAFKDSALVEKLKAFELQKALDYALNPGSPTNNPAAPADRPLSY